MNSIENKTEENTDLATQQDIQSVNSVESTESTDVLNLNNISRVPNNFSPNHSIRRKMMKNQGLLKQKNRLNNSQWSQHVFDQGKAGKLVHIANTEESIKNEELWWENKYKQIGENLINKGFSEEKAAQFIENMMNKREKRLLKKLKGN